MFSRNSFIVALEKKGLSEEARKFFFKMFEDELLAIFAKDSYKDKEQLQQDFAEFQASKSYQYLIEDILERIEEELGISLSFDDLKRLNPNRFKLCNVCGRPFLSFDNFNKMWICYKQDYIKFKMTVDKKSFFKGSSRFSSCYMESININVKKHYNKKKKEIK